MIRGWRLLYAIDEGFRYGHVQLRLNMMDWVKDDRICTFNTRAADRIMI